MSAVLDVRNLCKDYPTFHLENVTFSIDEPSIMGFIGRNGAGKTTTLKSILNLAHPTSGEVMFWGKDIAKDEAQIKQRIGYATGGAAYYQKRRIREIAKITSMFYPNWDNAQYRRYLEDFSLDENKRLTELSEGMKVKFNLALALSHHAELLILDEPTSGLDPVSRDELLELFMDVADQGCSILFSTHIISDLEKCADSITYIQDGRIVASQAIGDFQDTYRLVELGDDIDEALRQKVIGTRRNRQHRTALILASDAQAFDGCAASVPTLDEIMSHLEAK